jgi:hypothetical protein
MLLIIGAKLKARRALLIVSTSSISSRGLQETQSGKPFDLRVFLEAISHREALSLPRL